MVMIASLRNRLQITYRIGNLITDEFLVAERRRLIASDASPRFGHPLASVVAERRWGRFMSEDPSSLL
jgi:hypothetical protein